MLQKRLLILIFIIGIIGGLLFVGCEEQEALEALEASTANTSELRTVEKRAYNLVNNYRKSRGLKTLVWQETIVAECREHSQNMALGRVAFGHAGAQERMDDIGETIAYKAAAENVANNMGYDDPAQRALQGWIKSEYHHQNMIGDFDLTGMGVAQKADGTYYFTQIFIKKM